MSINLQRQRQITITDMIRAVEAQRQEVRTKVIDYLLTHQNPFHRTQVAIMRALEISQATLVKYLAELRGEGLVIERPFGTAVIYEILYDVAIARGFAEKYKIFDLDNMAMLGADNQEWSGKVYNFSELVYISARHRNGFALGFPIYDKDVRELIQAVTLRLNLGIIIAAIGKALESTS